MRAKGQKKSLPEVLLNTHQTSEGEDSVVGAALGPNNRCVFEAVSPHEVRLRRLGVSGGNRRS